MISGGVPLENDVDMLDLISGKSFIVARHKYEISWLHAFYFGSMFQALNLKREKKKKKQSLGQIEALLKHLMVLNKI